ncbi:MAG: phosphate acyltransferase PlsX [Bacteroidota bacterium]|nr:phosphate acyltransferase PlsX [Bacteroidota bacterium]
MRIGIDIMGGDFAPGVCVKGAMLASQHLETDDQLILFGHDETIRELLHKEGADPDEFSIVHAPEIIHMQDYPSRAFVKKAKASMVVGFRYLAKNEIDGFASAGNTGAMFVGAMQNIKPIPGVLRPAIAACYPTLNGKSNLILDVGLNPDSKPDVLYQYGQLGSLYFRHVNKVENPKVGLLNIGQEPGKGNLVSKSAYELMKYSPNFNFIGNIEGNQIFEHDTVDVVVTDGFIGNIVLKQTEAFYELIKKRGIDDDYFNRLNFENYGGTPILGVDGNVVIGHGISNEKSIANMILKTKQIIKGKLSSQIKAFYNYD